MKITVKGTIVENEDAWIYDYFGMENTCPKAIESAIEEANGEDIDIDINSGGGSVFAGSEIYSAIRGYNGNVNIHVVGLAASAASVIAMAGHSDIAPTAQLMVHNVSSCASGNYHDMDKMSEALKQANKAIASAYVAKTGMSMEDALALMDAETWISAGEAVERGLIDEVQGQNNANTSADFAKSLVAGFGNILPDSVLNKYRAERNKLVEELNDLENKEV